MRFSDLPGGLAIVATLALPLCIAATARAEHVVQYDSLSDSTQGAVTCGFCAGERFGIIFYDLPGGGGLLPSEFPLVLQELRVAVAQVMVTGTSSCAGVATPMPVPADIAMFAGESVPTDIAALSATAEWPGEVPLWDATLTLEPSVTTTGTSFEARFNIVDFGVEDPIVVDPPSKYLRVVVTIHAGGASSICPAPLMPPSIVPLRDDDGVIGPHRDFIWAASGASGAWLWNESVPGGGIHGDWAIRVKVGPAATVDVDGAAVDLDAGGSTRDGGGTASFHDGGDVARDGGAMDAGAGGAPGASSGGCGCTVVGVSRDAGQVGVVIFGALAALALARRRREVRNARTR